MSGDDRPATDEAYRCGECDRRWYYTRGRCPDCGGEAAEPYRLGEAELVAVTEVAVTPPDVRSPNWLGIAEFDDGVRLLAQLTGPAAVGDRVRFAGEHRLREGDERPRPRLAPVAASEAE